MTLLLNCQNVSRSLGAQTLFNDLSFSILSGDRLAVIGANGSGKTTLLRMLAGDDAPDSGRISLSQNTVISYLAQQDDLSPTATVGEILHDSMQKQLTDEAEIYRRVQSMINRGGFDSAATPVSTLSGGWLKRLAICRELLLTPDLFILDEPTNHLDLEGILWLEQLLGNSAQGSPGALVFVSHDRYFLEHLATAVLEISPLYPCGYSLTREGYAGFLHRREQLMTQQQEQESRLANRVQRETEWLRQSPKARTGKARFRVDEASRLQEELAQLQSRNRRNKKIGINFEATGRKTKKLLTATGLSKAFKGRILFSGLDITLSPGRRIGLLGKNGCGKSTLMQMLALSEPDSGLQPDSGEIWTADGVQITYFAQDRVQLDHGQTLRRALAPEGDSILFREQVVHVATWAQRFLFRTDQLETPVGNLSGGEKARIILAGIMRQPADILLLDEPTNDLDIPALHVLEESLLEFPGSVVLTTHDRFLMNRVCDQVLGFDGQGGVAFYADYEQWLRAKKANTKSDAPANPVKPKNRKPTNGRLTYLDQREYDGMEATIEDAEHLEQELLTLMADPIRASDAAFMEESWQKLEEVRERITRLYARWEELEDKKSGTAE